jgi:hypothetical protein
MGVTEELRASSSTTARVRDNLLPLGAIGLAAVALSVGWELFAARLEDRSARAQGASSEVARIWGPPLRQPQPRVQWRRDDAATVELARGELSKSDVGVLLEVQYRRRGVTEYPCYEALFQGTYEFRNPSPESAFVAFTLPLPVERDALMLRDLALTVDGREDAGNTEYGADRIVWTGRIAGERTAHFKVGFRARGQGRFGYAFEPERTSSNQASHASRPVTAFRMALAVRGAKGPLDFPLGSMAPTSDATSGDERVLVWEVNRLLSTFDVGVELPDTRGVSTALGKLTLNAPFFFLLFAGGLLVSLRTTERRARALHVLGLSAAYFLYFPLAAYLTAYLPWPIAASLALLGIGALAVVHVARFVGLREAGLVGLDAAFFLAAPAAAYLVPAHTGLILVLAGFCALGTGLQILGVAARRLEVPSRAEPLATEILPPPAPAGEQA